MQEKQVDFLNYFFFQTLLKDKLYKEIFDIDLQRRRGISEFREGEGLAAAPMLLLD